jgi:hypothetical protein
MEDERSYFYRTFSRPAIRRRKTATFRKATRSPSGARVRVGQFAVKSAFMLGAEKVVLIDHYPDRLELAQKHNENLETINFDDKEVYENCSI